MEAFGLVVGILQVSVYASSIVSTIKDIRQAIRNGPIPLQEKSQQLHILSVAVDNIGLSPQLHSKDIEASLSDVERLILRLQKIIRRRLLRPTDTSVRKLRAAISCIGGDKEVEQTFVALQGHCHFLGFYLQTMPTGSDKRVTEQLQNPAHTSAHDRGHILDPPTQRVEQLSMVYRSTGPQPSFMQETPAPLPTFSTPRTVGVKQNFTDMHATGKDSHLSAGNYTVTAAATLSIDQHFSNVRAVEGGRTKVGDTISEKDAVDGRKESQEDTGEERSST